MTNEQLTRLFDLAHSPHIPPIERDMLKEIYDALTRSTERLEARVEIDLKKMPALAWLISDTRYRWRGGPDNSCEECPFKEGVQCDEHGNEIPYSDIANDPSESYYKCSVLKKVVWGEYAPCTEKDWRKLARKELGLPEDENQ